MKALKVTISGSYRNSKHESVDFENVSGVIPFVDRELADFHVRGRYAVMWVKAATDKAGNKAYPERIDSIRQVFIDSVEEVDADLSFMGKDIKEMSYEELQDLATFKDLRSIPLPKEISGTSLREQRMASYVAYSDAVLGTDLNKQKDKPDFDFAAMPVLACSGGSRKDDTKRLSNEEILEHEQKPMDIRSTPKSNMTLDDLRKIAKEKNIQFHKNTGFDALYERIFG